MERLYSELSLTYVSWPELFLRVGLAMLFGLLLGLDRASKNKPIDFRAYMIVAVTTCIIAVLGQELYSEFSNADPVVSVDLAKIIAGVLTGIGFLGAGAIIHRGEGDVVGTATGASIWSAGGIGLALGFGYYGLALVAFLAVGAILAFSGWLVGRVRDVDER
ncbi:MgtC/SapB family protein [Pseudomarimonas salicorniae]|uniref:Protein MgtC n=1 Tax=Pseudomarimonas salicorniae TaxID=2933270 RepID=A0ABT0GDG3_9GAMM|nr:MgtC/SapB family protein [Lysobacter sp. CAU 1642]MCK7592065.1 MgtC/SapB family protein [Lysobacter sp. CAU 1642]